VGVQYGCLTFKITKAGATVREKSHRPVLAGLRLERHHPSTTGGWMEANVGEDYNNHMLIMYDKALTYDIDLSSLLLKRKWLAIPKSSQLIIFSMEPRAPKRFSMGKQDNDLSWPETTQLIPLSHQSKFYQQ
jgi:hypothetical protein